MSVVGKLASRSSVIFGGRLFGAGLTFIVQALIARFWGAGVLADYMLAIAAVNLVGVVMPLGFQTIGSYFAAEYAAKGQRGQLSAFLKRAYGHVLVVFAVVAVFGPLALNWFGQGQGVFAEFFWPIVLLAFASAVIGVNGAVLIGLKRPYAGYFADSVFRPIMVLTLFIILALSVGEPAAGFGALMWLISLGLLLISLAHFGFVLVSMRRVAPASEKSLAEAARWWRFAMPWVLIALATDFFYDIDLLLLAGLMDKQELAIFGVCTRIFSLVAFGVAAVYAVILPGVFESEANNDRRAVHRKVGEANLAATLTSLALLVLVLLFAPVALSIFGDAFTDGALPLAVLCVALVVRSVFGPASMVLSLHDRPWASMPSVVVGMIVLVLANLVLVPTHGLIGASLAALISISVWSFGQWLTALRVAQVDVSLLNWFRLRRAGSA